MKICLKNEISFQKRPTWWIEWGDSVWVDSDCGCGGSVGSCGGVFSLAKHSFEENCRREAKEKTWGVGIKRDSA